MSHKIIKSSQFVAMEGCSVIDTRFSIEQRVTQLSDGSDETEAISKQTAEIKQLLQEAQVERQEIIAQAIKESDEMRETAKATGFASGEEAGQKEGFQQGYEQGMQEALQQAECIKASALALLEEANAIVADYFREQKQNVVSLAAQMAERIIHEKIDGSDEKVMLLVTPLLHRLDREEHFITITVRPEQARVIKKQVHALEAANDGLRFAVLSDKMLEKNGCIIESSHAIIDLQIRKQLDAMVADLQNMEETVNV